MSIINKLTEGIVRRDLSKEGHALLTKWEKTGLLEGLGAERKKHGMACLLENQAKELLREASTMAGGDVEGFASVAFPIVRRVFGGLIANDLVSVQPMSLPSGLIFFLDFTYQRPRLDITADTSVYGGGVVGSQITGGVSLAGNESEQSFYALNNGYSSPTGTAVLNFDHAVGALVGEIVASGTVGAGVPGDWGGIGATATAYSALGDGLVRFDPDIASGTNVVVASIPLATLAAGLPATLAFNIKDYITLTLTDGGSTSLTAGAQVRRLTVDDPITAGNVLVAVAEGTAAATIANLSGALMATDGCAFVADDNFDQASAIGAVVGAEQWGLENSVQIPEIDIKVDSVAVTAKTKKLKAKMDTRIGPRLECLSQPRCRS